MVFHYLIGILYIFPVIFPLLLGFSCILSILSCRFSIHNIFTYLFTYENQVSFITLFLVISLELIFSFYLKFTYYNLFSIPMKTKYCNLWYKFVFWKSIHLEVALESFCFLINSSWLLIFTLIIILFIFTGFNLYCWTGIHFSQNYFLIFIHLNFGLIFNFHFWCRDLLRELQKKYEILLIIFFILFGGVLVSEALLFVSFFWTSFHSLSSPILGMWPGEVFYLPDPCELTFANTLLLSNAAISLGNAFINLEISSQFYIFFTLISFSLSSLFISLQIKEFRIMALSINDSLYSCLFFFLTGLHFFHLTIGLLLLSLLFWSCSFSY